jgi:hypothetical protein
MKKFGYSEEVATRLVHDAIKTDGVRAVTREVKTFRLA